MKNLNNTLTTILTNEKGFIRPYFNFRSNVNDLIEWGKDALKSEWDLEWEDDNQLEGIVNSMLGQISTKKQKELTMLDEMLLEFGSVFTHIHHENTHNKQTPLCYMFFEETEEDFKNFRSYVEEIDTKSEIYKSLKDVYKNEETILDTKLQREVVYNLSGSLINDYLVEVQRNYDELSARTRLSYTKLIIMNAATLFNMEEDEEDKDKLNSFLDSMISSKKLLEEIIIDEKINDLIQ